ncbi:P-loop containing nucleoside triphosphate hydrolase protein [Gigaspora rosea]|uniref:P-loop containing nucleoside triphosphate hydrolase protein n=1 Tax=Gigaspora rosea TaxID=44941 RepID=A0A397VCR9_9GLOM|nr:P-loop containing nucleoside triphosphate hydrolase protein [Gigaspora rosea]
MLSNKKPSEDNLPWVEKYRLQTLVELVSHKEITSTIERFINEGRVPHLLFYGPPGTGKTSTILACARKLYGDDWRSMVMELNTSDERGIDVVREQIKNYAGTRKMFNSGFKLIILDEADAMTQQAQNALRRDQVKSRLDYIIQNEKVNITNDGISALLKLSGSDMRRALNVLLACHSNYDFINESVVYECTGNPEPKDVEYIVNTMSKDEFSLAYSKLFKYFLNNRDFSANSRVYLFDKFSQIEYRLGTGGSEKFQLMSLLGSYKIAIGIARNENEMDLE